MAITLFGSLGFNQHGIIVHWGEPNDHMFVDIKNPELATRYDVQKLVLNAPAWKVLYVRVYDRNNLGDHSSLPGDHGWTYVCNYSVINWTDIRPVFDKYWATSGVYERVAFFVETWVYTEQQGWQVDDQF